MDAVRRATSSSAAFSAAFGGDGAPQGNASPFLLDDRSQEQQQHPESPAAPLPSSEAMSAGAARFLALPRQQQVAELESMVLELGRESSARAKAEARVRELENHPSVQLDALRRQRQGGK
jgi:hypothetical protein